MSSDYGDIKKIICYHSHMELNDYNLGDCLELERKLSIFDKIYYRLIPKGYIYDADKRALLIPAGVKASWIESLTNRPLEMNYDADAASPMSIRLLTTPRNTLQKESLSFLAGKGKYKNYAKYSQLILNIDTGEGKTYIAIALMTIKRLKTMIIVNSSKIKSQWIKSLQDYTDIDPKSICEIVGSPKCNSILENPDKYSQYKIFVTTHDTLRSFGDNHGWEKVHDLFKSLKIGVKIYDEAHLEFSNIVSIDCYTNTKYTYYLTATFGRSNISENFVYNNCFRTIPKFEQKGKSEYEGKRYISYIGYFYKSNPTLIQINRLKNKYGFNRNAYALYQLVDDEKFFDSVCRFIDLMVVNKKCKTLLLMTTIEGIEDMKQYLIDRYPGVTIGTYHSKISLEEKEVSLKCDLIISTVKSLGVGADIPNLRAVINTESYKSTIITEQILGRLRKLPNDELCYYIEIIDGAFMTLKNQQKSREKILKHLVGKILYIKE